MSTTDAPVLPVAELRARLIRHAQLATQLAGALPPSLDEGEMLPRHRVDRGIGELEAALTMTARAAGLVRTGG